MVTADELIRVRVEFPGMPKPLELSVPMHQYAYVRTHSDLRRDSFGRVVFRNPKPVVGLRGRN
jgi:hypothetical protein